MLLLAAVHFDRRDWTVTDARLYLLTHGMTAAYDLAADRDTLCFPQLPAPPRAGGPPFLVPLQTESGQRLMLVLCRVGALTQRVL